MNHFPYHFSNKIFQRGSVTRQFRLLFLWIVLVPLVIIYGIISLFSLRQQISGYEHLAVSKSTQVRTVFTTTATSINEVRTYFAQDPVLTAIFDRKAENISEEDFRSSLYAYTGFQDLRGRYASISDLRLYLDADVLGTSTQISGFSPLTQDIMAEEWYRKASATSNPFWIAGDTASAASGTGLAYYAKIPFPSSGITAILAIRISDDYLRNLIRDPNYAVAVNVGDGAVFYCDNAALAGNAFPVSVDETWYYEASGPMRIGNTREIASVVTLRPAYSNDRMHILVYDPSAYRHILRQLAGSALLVAAVTAACGIVFYFYAKYFSQRILTLRKAMGQAAVGDYEIMDRIEGDDELTETFADLRQTVETLKKNQAEIYERRLREEQLAKEQRETEMKLLASQINPHFLYNTLEMLRMKALIEGSRDLAGAIKKLGKIMRYVLGNTKTAATTLDKELDYIDAYLSIMKMRFGDRLSYSVIVSPDIAPAKIPVLPLIIQPPVENAIIHGIEESGRNGTVTITIEGTGENLLRIEISDDGVGMSAGELSGLRNKLDGPHPKGAHGVGLYNVNHRLRLYYGAKYGLKIESTPGRGTSVSMKIPIFNK